ncbi:MAG: LysR family transcriptional regulator, partial [Leptospiraceae bacterium]|nr:LysR family transcriptional regulator [Leptospiraceae bacterium]
MEFRQIRYFLEIHRAGSYVRAAGNLGLTQPALSRQISLLERELDARLFERGARSLRLTPQGVTFLDYAVRLDDLWREAYEVLNQDHSRQLMGEYSISTGGTVAAWILPEALNKIRKQFPDVSFRLYEGDASETRESLLRGEVDLGILTGPAREGGLIQKPFLTDRIVPVAARNHPVFRKKKIAMKDLALMDFVFFHPASAIRGVVDAGLRLLRFQPRNFMELASVESVIRSL